MNNNIKYLLESRNNLFNALKIIIEAGEIGTLDKMIDVLEMAAKDNSERISPIVNACKSLKDEWSKTFNILNLDAPLQTPDSSLSPIDPKKSRRKISIEIEVPFDFDNRLDMQWVVEREIQADRWNWEWK
jgi:hypothetical protein